MREFGGRSVIARGAIRTLCLVVAAGLASCEYISGGEPYQASSLKISISAEVIAVGGITGAGATPMYAGAGAMLAEDVSWSSSDTTVATVVATKASGFGGGPFDYSASATITGKSVGKATIRAFYGGLKDSAVVYVVLPP